MIDIDKLVKSNGEYAQIVALNMKKRRKAMSLTQKELSLRSGVSYASIRRFENTGNISLISLIQIARILDSLPDIEALFTKKFYSSIDEVIDEIS